MTNYSAGLVVYRLFKYRNQFSYIVSNNSSTSRTRFVRLLIISLVLLLGSLPAQIYVFCFNLDPSAWLPFSWEEVHGDGWKDIPKVPVHGEVFFDRWIHIAAAFLLFAFFGFGKDATLMYRAFLLKMGLGRWFPSIYHPHIATERQGSSSTRFGSISSRSKLLYSRIFSRKSSSSSP